MTEFLIENYTYLAIAAASFSMSVFLLFFVFKELRQIDKKYTYINEIFKQYLDSQRKDDNHVSLINKIKRQKSFD